MMELLPQLRSALQDAAEGERVDQMTAYMKHQFEFLGCRAGPRRVATKFVLHAGSDASASELLGFSQACWQQPEREFQYVATDLLRKHVATLASSDLAAIEGLVTTKSWWDTVDALAAWTVGPMVAADPALVEKMDEWVENEDMWLARTAILHQLGYKDRCDASRLFRYVDQRCADTDFFIRKALGWALRQHARVDPEGVRQFVESRGDALSALTRKEALKHL